MRRRTPSDERRHETGATACDGRYVTARYEPAPLEAYVRKRIMVVVIGAVVGAGSLAVAENSRQEVRLQKPRGLL